MSGYNTVLARNTENEPKSSLSTQSVAFSHYNHLSAQLPLDPATGKMVAGGVERAGGTMPERYESNRRKCCPCYG